VRFGADMRPLHEHLAGRLLNKLAVALEEYPRWFALSQVLLLLGAVAYTATYLRFSTNRNDLVSAHEEYQRTFLKLKDEFKFQDSLVAIVESEGQQKNRQFVERLALKLQRQPELFVDVYFKGDLKQMGPKALFFLPEETLEDLRLALIQYAPLIATFSQVNSLNSLLQSVSHQLRSAPDTASAQQLPMARTLPVLHRIVEEAAKSITEAAAPPTPGITALFGDRPGLYLTFAGGQIYAVFASAAREELEGRAIDRLRELVLETQSEVPGVNAGITGEPVLKHDEMAQAERDVHRAALLSLLLVAAIFIYGYHEIRRPLLATVCLLVGIGYTLGFATLTVGRLNILSITLVPILIGLAIDFGVHLISRYEEELRAGKNRHAAMHKALVFSGIGIFTSGFTTAGGFLAMILTDFKGVREMGLISGIGLLVCLVPMMTLLPLMLVRERTLPPDHRIRQSRGRRARLEQLWLKRPRLVLACGTILTVLAVARFPQLDFDYNLLHLQTRDLPSVNLEEKLMQSGSQSLLSAMSVATSLSHALELEKTMKALPSVASVNSMVRYLSGNQEGKLLSLREIKTRVGEIQIPSPDTNPVDLASLERSLSSLELYLGVGLGNLLRQGENTRFVADLRGLRDAVASLRRTIDQNGHQAASRLTAFQQGLLGDVQETLSLIRNQDVSRQLTAQDIPPFLRERFISPSGKFLLQIYPRGDVWQRSAQEEFVRELRTVDPGVTGSPVQIYEYTSLVKESFQKAGGYAAAVIAIIVALHFRRFDSVVLAFLPVVLGFCWTLGLMTLVGIPFNPVNIMSLTLLIGIGVTNGIHILNRFAEDPHPSILATSTGKAVLVSGLNTIAGFGSLLVAKHQGIASLGAVMAIGTALCMVASLTVLPAILNLLNQFGWSMTRKRKAETPAQAPRPPAER
jgi:hopanoid biosynthesis associated RND transporter like protein HpnN